MAELKLEKAPSVLVVEDDTELNRLVVTWLRRAKLEVFSAVDGEEAIEFLKQRDVSAILLDLMMPRKSGIEVIDYLREYQPKLLGRTTVMTAARDDLVERIHAQPIHKVIGKPFNLNELLEAAITCARKDRRTARPEQAFEVLIVDDDEASRYLLAAPLPHSFRHDTAASGADAIAKLKSGDYDVVLLDLRSPKTDGIEVLNYLHEHQKHMLDRVIVCTVDPDTVADYPCAAVIPKPIDQSDLLTFVESCIQRSTSAA